MTGVLKYAVIRFRPFAETGEFANIGVIVMRVLDGEMRFKLAPRRFARVKGFFDDVAYKAYDDVIPVLEEELSRLTDFLPHFPNFRGSDSFDELVRIRESSIVFSEARFIDAHYGLSEAAERLFARFVRREAAPQTPEASLTRSIRRALREAGVRGFHSYRLDDDLVPMSFPFALERGTLRAIKPVAFTQRMPMALVDHGAHWRRRFEVLLAKGKLKEGNILLAVEPPKQDEDGALDDAYNLALAEVRKLPFEIVEAEPGQEARREIVQFAERVTKQNNFFH